MAALSWLENFFGPAVWRFLGGADLVQRPRVEVGVGLAVADDAVETATRLDARLGVVELGPAGSVDNYALGSGVGHLRFTGAVAVTLSGLTGGVEGRELLVSVAGAGTVTLKHDATSTAANRIKSLGGDFAIAPNEWAWLVYDATALRWRRGDAAAGAGVPGGNDGEVQTKNGAAFAGATNVRAGGGYISFGAASFSTSGVLRFGSNVGAIVSFRNFADTNNITGLACVATNSLLLGSANDGTQPCEALLLGAPMTGHGPASSPWSGCNGQSADVDMGDADLVLTAAQYANSMLKIVSPTNSVDRTAFLPNATNPQGYMKWVWAADVNGQNVIVQDVAAGTTVTIADTKKAPVWVCSTGVERLGPDV